MRSFCRTGLREQAGIAEDAKLECDPVEEEGKIIARIRQSVPARSDGRAIPDFADILLDSGYDLYALNDAVWIAESEVQAMQNKIPLYPYRAKTAQERGEIEKWRESFRENCACAGGIDVLIRENFDGMHLKDGTVEKIVELYGYKRVEHVLANTVQERRGDGRFRPDNRAWAESHYIPEDEMHNYCFAARSHSAILDGFISNYRKLVMNLGMFDQKQCEPDSSELDYTGKVLVLCTKYPERRILVA